MVGSLAALTGCQFQPSVRPIPWPTLGSAAPTLDPRYSTPEPIPTAFPSAVMPTPTPIPTVVPFRPFEDLDCRPPMLGDAEFGYCRDALSDGYYIWARCSQPCPEWPYPGVEWRNVGESSGLRDFMQLIEDRDDALTARRSALGSGFKFLGIDGTIAALGWPTAECIVGGELTLGTSCVRFVLALIAAGTVGIIGFNQAGEFSRQADESGQSAREVFEELGP